MRSSIAATVYRFILAMIPVLFSAGIVPCDAADAVAWVNPYIGTGAGPIGYGGMMPFVTPPFGMTTWTPQTRQNKISGVSYNYEDKKITGFIGTHQAAIWMGDYGYVTVIPQTGTLHTDPASRGQDFQHADEVVHPDYYSVFTTGLGRQAHTHRDHCHRPLLLPPLHLPCKPQIPHPHRGLTPRHSRLSAGRYHNPRDHRLQPGPHGCPPWPPQASQLQRLLRRPVPQAVPIRQKLRHG